MPVIIQQCRMFRGPRRECQAPHDSAVMIPVLSSKVNQSIIVQYGGGALVISLKLIDDGLEGNWLSNTTL